MGRRSVPTTLKLLRGNPGKRPLNAREPMPKAPLADPPDWFSDEQRASWHYALEHAPPGMLRALDRSALVAWVVAEDLHAQASQMQQRMGLLVRVGKPPPV